VSRDWLLFLDDRIEAVAKVERFTSRRTVDAFFWLRSSSPNYS
jgi:uncharacterized protein with HEPN domain